MTDIIYGVIESAEFAAALASGQIKSQTLFSAIIETDLSTLRYSLDGTLIVIKTFNGKDPRTGANPAAYLRQRAAALGISYTEYDHAGILTLMGTPAWTPEEP